MGMNEKVAEVILNKNAIYVVKDGKMETIEAPSSGFGKQTVCWQDGKPTHIEYNYSKRID